MTPLVVLLICVLLTISSATILGIDVGDTSLVVHMLKKGSRPEAVLTPQARRRFPAFVAFEKGERLLGDDVLQVTTRCPSCISPSLLSLLNARKYGEDYGSSWDSPEGKIYPETLFAMLLEYIAFHAREQSSEPVHDVVITLPFAIDNLLSTLVHRAASLANLNVLGLLSSTATSALELRLRQSFEDEIVVFLDIGSHRTISSAVYFEKGRKLKGNKPNSLGGISVLNSFTELVGGESITSCIMQQFLERLVYQVTFSVDGDLLLVLLPKELHSHVFKHLKGSGDVSVQLTADDIVSACPELYVSIERNIGNVLKNLNISEVAGLVPIGGGVRSPKLLEKIEKSFGIPVLKVSNADEAASIGAVYFAASVHPSFAMIKFNLADYWPYDVTTFPSGYNQSSIVIDSGPSPIRAKPFVLLKSNSSLSVVAYGKGEVLLIANVSDPALAFAKEVKQLMSHNSTVNVTLSPELPKIKISFKVSPSNILEVSSVHSSCHVNITTVKEIAVLRNVSDTVNGTAGNITTEYELQYSTSRKLLKTPLPFHYWNSISIVKGLTTPENFILQAQRSVDSTAEILSSEGLVIQEPPNLKEFLQPNIIFGAEFDEQLNILKKLQKSDEMLREMHQIRNEFESYLYDVRAKLQDEDSLFFKSLKPHSFDELSAFVLAELDWFEFDSPLPSEMAPEEILQVFKKRMKSIRKTFDHIQQLSLEHAKRPEAVEKLQSLLTLTETSFSSLNDSQIRKHDRKEVLNKVKEISKWLTKNLEKQEKKQPYESTVITVEDITKKTTELTKLTRKILSKAPPKKEKTPKNETTSNSTTDSMPDEL
ncbi:hypothetical protein GEMRC1_003017 [Eukaryota sp. GEM-RC1]